MSQRSWGRERERLRAAYAAMTDAELPEVADDADSLTEVARATLRAEMLRRDIEAPPETDAELREAQPPAPKPVMAGRYRDLHCAAVASSLLEAPGIEGFPTDDNRIRLDWLISNALTGIQVWTRGDDATEARELLAAGIPETFEVEGIGSYQQPKCPNCGALDVSFEELNRRISSGIAFKVFQSPRRSMGWNCHGCRHTWDEPLETPAE
jgi:hypothetical protein